MTPKYNIQRALQPGPDKSILARYIRTTFDGKVGVAQAQDLAQIYLAYEEYTSNPRTYDGDFQELFDSLGRDFTRGIIRYTEMADLGDATSTQVFLDGLSALKTHLEEDTHWTMSWLSTATLLNPQTLATTVKKSPLMNPHHQIAY